MHWHLHGNELNIRNSPSIFSSSSMTMPSTHAFPFETHACKAIEPFGTGHPPGARTPGSSHHLATPSLFHSYLHYAHRHLKGRESKSDLPKVILIITSWQNLDRTQISHQSRVCAEASTGPRGGPQGRARQGSVKTEENPRGSQIKQPPHS